MNSDRFYSHREMIDFLKSIREQTVTTKQLKEIISSDSNLNWGVFEGLWRYGDFPVKATLLPRGYDLLGTAEDQDIRSLYHFAVQRPHAILRLRDRNDKNWCWRTNEFLSRKHGFMDFRSIYRELGYVEMDQWISIGNPSLSAKSEPEYAGISSPEDWDKLAKLRRLLKRELDY